MKVFIVLSALFACALANGYSSDLGGYESSGSYGSSDNGNYGGSDSGSYGGSDGGYGHVAKVAIIKTPIYKTSYIAKTVKLGETHKSYPVQEHKFSRSDYETPGATYAIPAVKTIQVTRPGYTTYIKSSITKAHVTNHQVRGPTITKPIYKTVVSKVLVPVQTKYESHGYGENNNVYSNAGGDSGSYSSGGYSSGSDSSSGYGSSGYGY